MKKEILKRFGAAALAAALLFLGACSKNNGNGPGPGPNPNPGDVSAETQAQNIFAQLLMTDIYLWSAEASQIILSQKLNYETEKDPIAFFDKMVYKDDRWSEMTNDLEALKESFSGTQTTYGYSWYTVYFVDANNQPTGEYCAVLQYVYDGGPAQKAGLKRGDILIAVDGQPITAANFNKLYKSTSVKIDLGIRTAQGIVPKGESVSMTAVRMYEDPILYTDVIEKAGKKIGYLFYTNYVLGKDNDPFSGLNDLLRVFGEFKSQNVDEVILDLRYNGGGYAIASEVLCNILAPESAGGKIMTKDLYNSKYAQLWGKSETLFGDKVKFTHEGTVVEIPITVNMNLPRLYVLTTSSTASASESTIIGLMPYMDVIRIGGTTHGKYCGGMLLGRDSYTSLQDIAALKNWGAYTMVYQFTNKDNISFVNGLAPQYEASENIWNMANIGDQSDPMLAKALEVITGTRSAFTRSVAPDDPEYRLVPAAQTKTNALDGKMIDLRTPEMFR